jgi:hypothetical protein
MSRRNAKHFGGKVNQSFRCSRQIKIEGRNFYLEYELPLMGKPTVKYIRRVLFWNKPLIRAVSGTIFARRRREQPYKTAPFPKGAVLSFPSPGRGFPRSGFFFAQPVKKREIRSSPAASFVAVPTHPP